MDLPLATFAAGVLLGVSLAAPPGPVTALMASEVLQRGPRRGLLVGLGASTADFGFFLLAFLGAIAVLPTLPALLGAVSLLGAALLAWYAWGAWRAARQPAREGGVPRAGFAQGFLAAATSPFNLAWWIGPGSVLIAQAGLAIVAGMFAGILGWVVVFTVGLAALGRRVRRLQEGVAYASAAILVGFAAWVAWRGMELLRA
ncbi:MAG: LysE family translocator [Halobacteriales archaeon]|nr:LysE family translocator [Halobacteriales archaeon]